MPRTPKPPPPTLVLLVRHGQTPTTGSTLPGRAKGLHLADRGRAQAEAAAARIGALKKVAAVYASPLERTRETAKPIAAAVGCSVRRSSGACSSATSASGPAPSSRTCASCRSGAPCSATPAGSASPTASRSPRCRPAWSAPSTGWWPATPARPSSPSPTPTPSRRRWPRPSAPTSTCSSASSCRPARSPRSTTPPAGPAVLASNSTGDDLTAPGAVVSDSYDFSEPDRVLPGAVGEPGQRTFFLQVGRGSHRAAFKLEKQQVAALCEYLGGILADLPPVAVAGPGPTPCPSTPARLEWVVGRAGGRLRGGRRPDPRGGRGVRRRRGRHRRRAAGPRDPHRRGPGHRPHPPHPRARSRRSSGSARPSSRRAGPPCPLCGRPLDPQGHAVPEAELTGPWPPTRTQRRDADRSAEVLTAGEVVGARAHALELQRHLPRRVLPRRRGAPGDLQAPPRASARCGTSPTASTAARSPPTA